MNNNNTLIGVIAVFIIAAAVVWFYSVPDLGQKKAAEPVLSVSAFNQTQTVDAPSSLAYSQDIIEYILVAQNPSDDNITGYEMKVSISDIAKLATLIDAGGAAYDSDLDTLSWTSLNIPANESVQKRFLVRINDVSTNETDTDMELELNNKVTVEVSRSYIAGAGTDNGDSEFNAPPTGSSGKFPLIASILASISFLTFRIISRKQTIKL